MTARSKPGRERPGGVYVADAAKITGVSTGTLRAWEKHGLVQPGRTTSGYRVYSADDLRRLSEIKKFRSTGLPVGEILRRLPQETESLQRTATEEGNGQSSAADNWGPRGIGRRLRVAREANGISIRKLAFQSGLAASYISAIERSIAGPSIAALQQLAESLGTNIPSLVGIEPTGDELVRADERRTLNMGVNGVRFELVANIETSFEPMVVTVEPGMGSFEPYAHEGEEFIYVIDGRLRMILDETQVFDLEPADSLTFESHRPHRWWATSDTPAVLVWVNSPPTF